MSRSGQEATPHAHTATTAPDAAPVLGGATLALATAGVVAARTGVLSPPALAFSALAWIVVCTAVVIGLRHHPHRLFGAANAVTTLRALIAVALGAFAVEAGSGSLGDLAGPVGPGDLADPWLWCATLAAVIALALDGIDGPLARAAGLDSTFGARYDMEIDALLAFVLAALIWRTGELGIWILALGTMRYAFLAAARVVPALNAPLYSSFRRKAVCVVQIAALCAIVSPLVRQPLAIAIGAGATGALGWSFARDTLWLLRQARERA